MFHLIGRTYGRNERHDPYQALLIHANTIRNEAGKPTRLNSIPSHTVSCRPSAVPHTRCNAHARAHWTGRYPATLTVSVGPTPRLRPVRVARRPMAPHEREGHQLRWGLLGFALQRFKAQPRVLSEI